MSNRAERQNRFRVFFFGFPAVLLTLTVPILPAQAEPGSSDVAQRFGLTVLEAATSNPVPERLRDDYYGLVQSLVQQNPDDFGYPFVTGESINLPVTSALSRPLLTAKSRAERLAVLEAMEAVRAKAPRGPEDVDRIPLNSQAVLSSLDESMTVQLGTQTYNQVESTKHSVIDFAIQSQFSNADAWRSTVDIETGIAVLVVGKLTPELGSGLREEFGPDRVAIRIEPKVNLGPDAGGRQDDNPTTFYGGARIFAPGGCSSGFAWSSSGTYPMITAGHCSPGGDPDVRTP